MLTITQPMRYPEFLDRFNQELPESNRLRLPLYLLLYNIYEVDINGDGVMLTWFEKKTHLEYELEYNKYIVVVRYMGGGNWNTPVKHTDLSQVT